MKIADMCVRIDIWYGRHVVCVVSKDSSSWGIEHYDNNEISANIMLDLSVFLSMRWCEGLGTTTIIRSTMCLTAYLTYKPPNITKPSSSFFSQATLADDLYPSQPQLNKVHLYCLLDCCRCRLPSTRKFCLYAMAPTSTNFILFIVRTFLSTTILRTPDHTILFLSLLMNWRLTAIHEDCWGRC